MWLSTPGQQFSKRRFPDSQWPLSAAASTEQLANRWNQVGGHDHYGLSSGFVGGLVLCHELGMVSHSVFGNEIGKAV